MTVNKNPAFPVKTAAIKEPALWLNVGYHNANGEYVRVPMGMLLKTPAQAKADGYRMTEDQEALLKMLTDQASSLESGSECEVKDFNGAELVIQVRKPKAV